jgi:RND family efflux transporter MFP subunit
LQLQRSRSALAQALARLGLPADAAPDARPEETPAMKQAKAQLDDAKSKFDRTAKLVKTGDVAQESYIAAEKAYQAREAAYESMRDDMLTQWAAISGLRAEVALAEKRLRDTKLYAPFDGAVTQRQVSPGQYIKDNTPVLSVVKNWPLRLRVEIPEPAVSEVKVGSELSFTTEAVPGETFHARVRELNPSLDPRSRTLTAEAMLAKADPRLRPGAFVQVRLVTEKAAPVIAIPKDAVYTVAGLNKFFTIENGKAVEHKIPEVLGSDGWVEMPEGTIAAGARVAVSNVAMLTNGAPVTVVGGRS